MTSFREIKHGQNVVNYRHDPWSTYYNKKVLNSAENQRVKKNMCLTHPYFPRYPFTMLRIQVLDWTKFKAVERLKVFKHIIQQLLPKEDHQNAQGNRCYGMNFLSYLVTGGTFTFCLKTQTFALHSGNRKDPEVRIELPSERLQHERVCCQHTWWGCLSVSFCTNGCCQEAARQYCVLNMLYLSYVPYDSAFVISVRVLAHCDDMLHENNLQSSCH